MFASADAANEFETNLAAHIWRAVSGNQFSSVDLSSDWSFSPDTCALTYVGVPDINPLIAMSASLFTSGGAAALAGLGIDRIHAGDPNDLIGEEMFSAHASSSGCAYGDVVADGTVCLTVYRRLLVRTNDILKPCAANFTGNDGLTIHSLYLSIL